MKAAYGIVQSKGTKIGIGIILVLYAATLVYLIMSREWVGVVSFLLNLVVFYFILRKNATQYIRITDNDRLMLGAHQFEIQTIDRISFYDNYTFRVYYTFGGEARISPKMQLKEKDKEDFLNTLTAINPNIQIN